MASPPFIAARVTPEMKSLLRVLAEREQKTESALIRQLLEIVLRTCTANGITQPGDMPRANREIRVSVRLDPNDGLLLKERAAARCVPSATYIAALVRSHLRGITPLLKEERQALELVVAELTAVGRNLNQVVRALNRDQCVPPRRDDVHAMLRVCGALRDHVKALLAANEKSWNQGHVAPTR